MVHKYKVFGLYVHSELEIPDLQPSKEDNVDVEIVFREIPDNLPLIIGNGAMYQAAPNDFLFKLNSIGAFRVMKGSIINVDIEQNVNIDVVRLFLLGSVFGALLFQRNILPIHGSALRVQEKSIIISGVSSAGKSSLASYMVQKGYSFLSDDITALSKINGCLEIQPGIPYIKIWRDVLDHLGNKNTLQKVRPELEKYKIPVQDSMNLTSTQPNIVIQLEPIFSPDYKIIKVSGTQKFNLLWSNIYRSKYIIPLGLSTSIFHSLTLLAKSISYYRIQRPISPLNLEKLSKLVIEEIIRNEK